jgi:hypothetical protein
MDRVSGQPSPTASAQPMPAICRVVFSDCLFKAMADMEKQRALHLVRETSTFSFWIL